MTNGRLHKIRPCLQHGLFLRPVLRTVIDTGDALPRAIAVIQACLDYEMLIAHPRDYRLMHVGREGAAEIMKLPFWDASILSQLYLDLATEPCRNYAISCENQVTVIPARRQLPGCIG